MKILSIETSCDETAISLIEASGDINSPSFKILGNALSSQINIHKEFGGVFPMIAKREHAKSLIPLLKKVLGESNTLNDENQKKETNWDEIENVLKREEGLYPKFKEYLDTINKPSIDLISVTSGPGLEPALWVGISFAEALGKIWGIPVIPINHMEGHIFSILNENNNNLEFPALALLISGGHTEIVKMNDWGQYEIIGETLDDAVGEAFDKVARLLGLPYPGGPEISKLAKYARDNNLSKKAVFPRPMIKSGNYSFSFSGLKTAVLYYIRDKFYGKIENLSEDDKADIAREFEDSVTDVLISKVDDYLSKNNVKTLIIAGGVVSNDNIKQKFNLLIEKYVDIKIKIPKKELSTDNSLMIAMATYIKILKNRKILDEKFEIIAQGNLKLK